MLLPVGGCSKDFSQLVFMLLSNELLFKYLKFCFEILERYILIHYTTVHLFFVFQERLRYLVESKSFLLVKLLFAGLSLSFGGPQTAQSAASSCLIIISKIHAAWAVCASKSFYHFPQGNNPLVPLSLVICFHFEFVSPVLFIENDFELCFILRTHNNLGQAST